MELAYLKEFVVISDLLNFSKAARTLYTTQPVLSKHVAKMETELGVKLFERDSHSMALTDEGRLFLEYARLIANKYDEALVDLESMANSASRIVTVGYLVGTFGLAMPKLKKAVEKRCPDITLRLRSLGLDGLRKELVEGKVDVILTYDISPELRRVCNKTQLGESRIYVVVPKDGPLSSGNQVSVDDLRAFDFLLPDPGEWPIVSSFYASVIPGYSSLRCIGTYSDIDTLIYTVHSGSCIGLSCGAHASFGPLVDYVPIQGIDTSFGLSALWLTENDKAQVRRFVDALENAQGEWSFEDFLAV